MSHRTFVRCALLIVASLGCLSVVAFDASATTPTEMQYACALKSNGQLRYVTSPTSCGKNESLVTFKPGPVLLCVQPSGSTRKVSSFKDCKPPATQLTLPPTSGIDYFCVDNATRVIRYVADPSLCTSTEFPVQVSPNDAAPAVSSTSPANGATHVGTQTNVGITFSESVTVSSSAFTFTCNSNTVAFSLSGSPGSVITLDPTSDLPTGTSCTVTVVAANVSDTDTIDPPDHPTANYVFSFTTDAPPSVSSTLPTDGASNVAVSSNVTINFSEPVHAAASAFSLICGASAQAFNLSGDGTASFTLDPVADLPNTASCTVSVTAAGVTDVDAGDPPDAMTSNYSFSFSTVDTAPSVSSTSPVDGATGVATDATIGITFSEPVTAPDSAFALECPTGTPVAFTGSGSPGTSITLTPSVSLPQSTTCTVTVTASGVSDVDSFDPPDTMASSYSFSFSTDAAPALTSSTPANGATNVDPASAITANFSEAVDVTTSSFTVVCNSASQPFGVTGSGTSTITITPTADLPSTASCTVTAVAAQISDTDAGDPPDHPASDATFSFTTQDAAPAVTGTTPADGTLGVSRSTTIKVTFSEPVTATDGSFTLECPSGTSVGFTTSGSPGTVITLTPSADLPVGASCAVTVLANQISDVDAIDPPDHMASNYSFGFTVAANSAPTDISLTAASVDENQPSGTAVGTLSTTDPDAGDTFIYSLATGTGDTDNGSFVIDGDVLKTNASFDFETQSSYSIRVRSTDSGSAFVEKQFTITVNDVNEAPTNISLTNSSIDENQPSGTTVGALSATDPDTGQTHAFTLESAGCGGGPFADNTSFAISSGNLNSAVSFDYETKNSYTICVRATDNGTPQLTFDEQFTITINNVNDPPVAGADSYSGAIGNTLAVVATTASGPVVTLSSTKLLANDTDQDGNTLSAVAESVSTTGGGTATINSDGSFTYLPGVGDKSQNDTFTYHVTDGTATTAGTVTVHIDNFLVWYVDNSSAASSHDGRSTSPLLGLTGINGAGGSGDSDGTGDIIFVYAGSGSYTGGLPLEANQKLWGQKRGLVVNAITLVAAGTTAPTITNASGVGVGLADGVDIQGVTINGASGDGLNGASVNTATVGTDAAVSITGSGGDGVDLGSGNGNVSISATISGNTGRAVIVSGRTGGTTGFNGSVTGTGVTLSTNSGATINFTGGLTLSSGSTAGFTATGGGTVNVTGNNNTVTSTTGTALNVDNTTIGASDLTFKSISANGAADGIRLVHTGTSGGLTLTGAGTATQGGDSSGGTITNATGAGVLLNDTRDVNLTNLTITNTPNAPGIDGTAVTNFAFAYGSITGSGSTSHGAFDSNIAFNDNGTTVNNVDGTLSVTNSTLENAYQHGIDVLNNAGTLSDVQITGNLIQSPTTAADSAGSGVRIQELGSSGTAGTVTTGSISTNTIVNFPNGAGVVLSGGNTTGASATAGSFGTSGHALVVNGNSIHGQSVANPMSTNCILVTMAGRGSGYVDVTNNGSVATPLGLNKGNCISVNSTGAYTLNSNITGNIVSPQAQISGSFGIAGGADKQTLADLSVADTAALNATISNNNVSNTTGSGIRFLANSNGTLRAKIQNNTVSAPTDTGSAIHGIRIDSGTSSGTAVNTTVCLQISGNNSAGNALGSGIGLRKQGTISTTNTFGVVGLSPSPATAAQTQTYVASQNSPSTVLIVSGDNFVSCTLPF